jgi:hypothetical protein
MTFALSATIGGLISVTGIVLGNAAIWKMMDAYEDSVSERREEQEMFMTDEVANPGNRRILARNWYCDTQPGGKFLKMLRCGQVLSVTGALVMFALLAI